MTSFLCVGKFCRQRQSFGSTAAHFSETHDEKHASDLMTHPQITMSKAIKVTAQQQFSIPSYWSMLARERTV